jgi:PAS domain S-box-containing protein
MFTHITGYTREDALGQNPRILQSGVYGHDFYAGMWQSLAREGHWSGEMWNRHKNGELIAESLTIDAVRDANGNLQQYVALFSDITQLKKSAQQIEQMAHFDVLRSSAAGHGSGQPAPTEPCRRLSRSGWL